MRKREPDCIVVGAGLAGLAAAVELAAHGRSVRVAEMASEVGGKAAIASYQGVEFDTGPSLLTLSSVWEALFRRAGTCLRDEVELLRPDVHCRYLWPDGTQLTLHADQASDLAEIERVLGVTARDEWHSFMRYAAELWQAARPFLSMARPTLSGLLRPSAAAPSWRAMPRLLSQLDPGRSMRRAVEAQVATPHLRDILLRLATYNGSDARCAPATLLCIAHVEFYLGTYGVRGGLIEVVRALRRTAERLGVEFRCGTTVRRLLVEGNRLCGIETESGETWRAAQVVVNAEVRHLQAQLLGPRCVRRWPRRLTAPLPEPAPSLSAYNAVLCAKQPASGPRSGHTVLFGQPYLEEFAALFDRHSPPAQPTVYLCAQDVLHQRPGWPDGAPLFLMSNLPPLADGQPAAYDWLEHEKTVLERLRHSGLLVAEDRIVWRRSPADLAQRFPGSCGSLYGSASNSLLATFCRPANRVANLPGLYLASGTAHPGGGMPLALLSGHAAAQALLADTAAMPASGFSLSRTARGAHAG